MTEALPRCDTIANEPFALRQLREAATLLARLDEHAVRTDLEHATGSRDERELADLCLERREELLRHPRSSQKPPALRALADLHPSVHPSLLHRAT